MRQKVKTLERLVRIQTLMRDVAQWRHAAAELEAKEIEQGWAEVLASLTRDQVAYGALGAAATRHAQKVEARLAGAMERRADAVSEAMRHGERARVMREALVEARGVLGKLDEHKTLTEIGEACLRGRKQG